MRTPGRIHILPRRGVPRAGLSSSAGFPQEQVFQLELWNRISSWVFVQRFKGILSIVEKENLNFPVSSSEIQRGTFLCYSIQ